MSRSGDSLEMHVSNVSVWSQSRQRMGKSRSFFGLKAKHLNLVSVSDLNVLFTSGEFFIFFIQSRHEGMKDIFFSYSESCPSM